ncbi:MAG TPA: PDZ domain-containing protein, partial [Pirellulales bacterium]
LGAVASVRADDKAKGANDAQNANQAKTTTNATDSSKNDTARTNQADAMHGYLGVSVEPLHESVIGHLEHLIGKGRGVLVSDVAKDSPAEKAGLQRHDIIVSYDDQNLYSPEQLSKLIHHDKAGRQVTLNIVRSGEKKELKATIGEHRASANGGNHSRTAMQRPRMRYSHEPAQDREAQWSMFDSMTLTREDNGKFKAEIKYKNDQGKTDSVQFEGTRDELRKDIDARQDLPANEREHLMRALDLPTHEFSFPNVFFIPDDSFWGDEG